MPPASAVNECLTTGIGPGAVKHMRKIVYLCSALLFLLCSCTVGEWVVGESGDVPQDLRQPTAFDYSAYFKAFDNPWVGRTRDELLDTLGPPDGIYEARHQFADYDAGIPASTYIYTDSFASSGHCVDAYVIDEWTSTVIKYYCR
ncbi:MAG: hypothetical protein OEV03_10460 [Gammaproteobacteria bacterium]|jgi:hypothetical protein|nr:hypothetical protein [Gammaproteobacteria bacterium]MDH3954633.1 hypothetical protein [Gammaproteobacteria bacterium]NCF60598.1 hypothetical protein [Gammaproteobacteria bacterium]